MRTVGDVLLCSIAVDVIQPDICTLRAKAVLADIRHSSNASVRLHAIINKPQNKMMQQCYVFRGSDGQLVTTLL